jgi:hypothetical protein
LRLDIVLEKIFEHKIVINNPPKKDIVRGIKKDNLNLKDPSGMTEQLLYSPEWPIMASIAFSVDGRPSILTCEDHNKGTSLDYLHPPRNPYGFLLAKNGDQLAPAVVVPRTLKPMKMFIQ